MSLTRQQIFEQAQTLSAEDRESLAEELWLSASGTSRQEIDDAWLDEVKRRDEALSRGEMTTSPINEAIDRVLARKQP